MRKPKLQAVVRASERSRQVSAMFGDCVGHVGAKLGVDERRVGIERTLRARNCGQGFVLHVDQIDRITRKPSIGGNHRGQWVAGHRHHAVR